MQDALQDREKVKDLAVIARAVRRIQPPITSNQAGISIPSNRFKHNAVRPIKRI